VKIELLLIRRVEITIFGFLVQCYIEMTSILGFAGMDRQAIYMRSLLNELRKRRGNFPLIFARLHSRQFEAIRY